MAKHLKAGDRVSWNTSQGQTHGKVVRKQTRPTKIKGHEVASADHPEYVVRSDKSGDLAAHEASALHRR